jgi:hypothetical protein
MQIEELTRLKTWFDTYARSFLTGDAELDNPLTVKIQHTARVCDNIVRLARSVGMPAGKLRLAEAIGLFHDIGRFEQYRRYRTFNDRKSANHAALGIDVLRANAVMDSLPPDEMTVIIDAVRFHNAPVLPVDRPSESLLGMRLIRDADKLDIWKLFADYYHSPNGDPTIIQHMPDRPACNENILRAIEEKRMARLKDMKSLNDFKLLQLSWVFDLNFRETFVQAMRRGDLATIARTLPGDDRIRRAIETVMDRLTATAAA